MFQRPLPGYDPRGGGGITDVAPPAFTQSVASSEVAARPLLVSDRAPVVFGNQAGRFAGVTNEQLLNEYTTLESSIQQAEDTPLRGAGPVPDLSAQKAELNVIGQELNNRNVSVEPEVDEVAAGKVTAKDLRAPEVVDSEAVTPILNAAAAEADAAVARGEVSPEEALATATAANAALESLQKAEDSLEEQFKAVGVGEEFTAENYKQKAKDILGVDASEDDIPEWAAPIFLFGLNLMKAPVSSQTGQQGLGGLLADIGAAGEVGFKQFAVERARKQARREKIGALAYQMMNADKASRVAMAQAEVKKAQWNATFRQEATKLQVDNFNKTFDRWTGKIDDPEQLATFSAEFNALAAVAQASGRLGDPVVTNLIGALATERAGIRTPFQMETVNFGHGKELSYSAPGLKRLASKEGTSEGALLSAIIADPDNPKYAGVAVAVNITKNQFEDKSVTENGVTIPRYEDIALRDAELAAAKTEGREVNPAAYRLEQTAYLEAAPNFKKIELGNVEGEQKYAYMDYARLGLENQKRRKAGKAELTMTQILRQPMKYPGIISPEFSDTSGALDNISIVDIYTGPDSQQKFIFNRNLLDQNRTQVAEALGIPADQVNMSVIGKDLDLMEQLGILIPSGDEKVDVDKITLFRMNADGGFTQYQGSAGDMLGVENKAEQAKLVGRLEGTENVNNMAFRVFSIYDDLVGKGQADNASSAFTGVFTGLTQAARLSFFPNLGREGGDATALSRLRDFEVTSSRTNVEANDLINGFEDHFNKWAEDNNVVAAERQKLKTIFIDMAFSLASAREAGKLTDNDVKWAFQTLGFDTNAFLQSPEIVVNGLREAVTQINQKMERSLAAHTEESILLGLETAREGLSESEGVYVLEHMLRNRQRHVAATESNWGRTGADKRYRVDHFLKNNPRHFQNLQTILDPGGAATVGPPDQTPVSTEPTANTINYGNQEFTYTGESPLTEVDQDRLLILSQKGVKRTPAGIITFLDGISDEAEKAAYTELFRRLRDNGNFFSEAQQ